MSIPGNIVGCTFCFTLTTPHGGDDSIDLLYIARWNFLLIHSYLFKWNMIMQTDVGVTVVIYICGSRGCCQVINEST